MLETGSGMGLKCEGLQGWGCGHVLHTTINRQSTQLIHVVHAEAGSGMVLKCEKLQDR